jgi:pSer/pThr/pTyr-binding forkhead associated (FHA) protein
MNEHELALERFRQACGVTTPLAIECEATGGSPAAPALRPFDAPFLLVGRDPGSDLFLADAEVSRRHAFLQAVAGRILVTDLESRSKVWWEGEDAPRGQGWLAPERFIRVGPYRLRWRDRDLGGDRQGSSRDPRSPGDVGHFLRAALELPIRVGDGPSLWPVEGPLATVGRCEGCQLVLTDDSISRFHAALVSTPSGLWVVDLLAREGVHVNGVRVRWAWLADGDALRVGRFTFILRYETPPDRLTRQDVPLEAGASPANHPGTELAVRSGPPQDGRGALVMRREGPAPAATTARPSPHTIESAPLVPPGGGVWEPSSPDPPSPMAMWQQQMQLMELFHKDMIMMMQMFVAMHREHLASVREELGMVKRLTRELAVLQARMVQSPETEPAGRDAGIARPSQERGPSQALDRKRQDRKRPAVPADRAAARTEPKPTEPAGGPGSAGSGAPSGRGPASPASSGMPSGDERRIHAQLTQRIAELQRERQGYWERILGIMNR